MSTVEPAWPELRKDLFTRATGVVVGSRVWVPCADGSAVRCKVIVATGDMAQVQNMARDITRWEAVVDLYHKRPEVHPTPDDGDCHDCGSCSHCMSLDNGSL